MGKLFIVFVLIFLVVFGSSLLLGANGADQLMQQGKYKAALEVYQKIIQTHPQQVGYALYFNAAGAAAKVGEYGLSALYYKRAELLYDGDSQLKRNLSIVEARSGANRFDVTIPPVVKVLFFYYFSISRSSLLCFIIIGGVLLLLLIGSGFLFSLLKRASFRWGLLSLVFLLAVAGISLAIKNVVMNDSGRAIVVTKTGTALRSQFLFSSPVLVQLPPATELKVQKTRDGSCQVVLPGGAAGWVSETALRYINK